MEIQASRDAVLVPKDYSELCAAADYPAFGGERLDSSNRSLKLFKRANRIHWMLYGGSVYSAGVDYDDDGIKDFYLVAARHSYASSREDWTGLYIVSGIMSESETPEPSFASEALKTILFTNLDSESFGKRNASRDRPYIITAKATPVEFKNEIYLKVEAQLADAQNPNYRSAYSNDPDWTTYVKINHLMELEPIC